MDVRVNVVSEGYLDALGIRLLRGRDFQPSDQPGGPRVAIVSEALASRLWPNQDPLGRSFGSGASALTVIGVAPDTVYRSVLERQQLPFFYIPLSQNYESGVALHVRAAAGDPLSLLPAIRTAVRDVDPRIVVARPQRLADVFDQSLTYQRLMATLVSFFGGTALLLAAVGLYGVMAHLVGQRRAEIGIRFALGARPQSIFKLVLGEALRLVAIGTALGLAGALVATRYIETQLFGVKPIDPLTFAGACLLLTIVAALACLIPARRAMRVDPVVALRST
jgi:predicted permease